MTNKMTNKMTVTEFASLGGKSGRGKSKVRGDSGYYRKIRAMAGKKKKGDVKFTPSDYWRSLQRRENREDQ